MIGPDMRPGEPRQAREPLTASSLSSSAGSPPPPIAIQSESAGRRQPRRPVPTRLARGSGSGLAGIIIVIVPLQQVKCTESKLGAELRENAGVP